jgi:hypothetical protein
MAHCETIIMVFNRTSPSFTALAEAGWAALGAQVRGQAFIMQIDHDVSYGLPDSLKDHPDAREVNAGLAHWVKSGRYLVEKHARAFAIPTMHVVATLDDIVAILRKKYG